MHFSSFLYYMRYRRFDISSGPSFGNALLAGIILIGVFIGLYWVARGIFSLLSFLAPVMLIITAILNYRVITGYAQWLWDNLKKEPLMGLLYVLLTVVGFPIVSAYLLFKAIAQHRRKKMKEQFNSHREREISYTEYEILEDNYLDITSEEELHKYDKYFDQK